MRRRDLGTAALAGLGLAAIGGVPRRADAAETLIKGTGTSAKAVKGSDKKFYVLPSTTVKLRTGMQAQFAYQGMTGEPARPTFKLVDVGTASSEIEFDVVLNGTPSAALDTSPAKITVIDSAGTHPIDVQQPGG